MQLSSLLIPLLTTFVTFSQSVNSAVTPDVRTVEVGGCVDVLIDELLYCAAIGDECSEDYNIRFRTSDELKQLLNAKCTTEDIPLGTCRSTGNCVITKDSCVDPTDFIEPDVNGSCNAEGSSINGDFVPTQYGGCKDGTTGEIVCVLAPEECLEREAWIPPSVVEENLIGGCRCHDVRVGLCSGSQHHGYEFKCAISADDCNYLTQGFQTAREVMDQPFKDCRLCPYQENLIGGGQSKAKPSKAKTSNAMHKGAITGIIVSCVSITLLVVVMVVFYYNGRKG